MHLLYFYIPSRREQIKLRIIRTVGVVSCVTYSENISEKAVWQIVKRRNSIVFVVKCKAQQNTLPDLVQSTFYIRT